MTDNVTFIPNMKDLGPEVQRLYSKRVDATASAEEYVNDSIKSLERSRKQFIVCEADDLQRPLSSRRDLQISQDDQIKLALDKKKREPKRLVFYKGALFEATVNEHNSYSQSQVLMMLEVPTRHQLNTWSQIPMLAAPPKFNPTIMSGGETDRETLLNDGWTDVKVKVAPERNPVTTYGSEAHRRQYTLRHLGSSIIHRQMGNTIHAPIAIKVSTSTLHTTDLSTRYKSNAFLTQTTFIIHSR